MNLEKHISNLLYLYDCIIIPDFGGLLTQKTSAQFNSKTCEFLPPTKKLRFNSSLKNNDGLLINYISQVENNSFSEVSNLVQNSIKKWKAVLVAGKKLTLKNIGVFHLNKEGSLVFEPLKEINYAKDSFGLIPIKAPYILREEKVHTKTSFFPVKKALMAVAGVLLLAFVGTLGYTQKDQVKYQMATLFDLTSSVEDVAHYSFISHDPALYPQPHVMEPITNKELESVKIKDVQKKVVKQPAIKKKKKETKVIKKPVVAKKSVGKYQLIGGAFKNKINAHKRLKELKAKGYHNAQILGVLSGMTIVSYNTYHSQQEAQKEVNRLKNQGKQVWLRTKK